MKESRPLPKHEVMKKDMILKTFEVIFCKGKELKDRRVRLGLPVSTPVKKK